MKADWYLIKIRYEPLLSCGIPGAVDPALPSPGGKGPRVVPVRVGSSTGQAKLRLVHKASITINSITEISGSQSKA